MIQWSLTNVRTHETTTSVKIQNILIALKSLSGPLVNYPCLNSPARQPLICLSELQVRFVLSRVHMDAVVFYLQFYILNNILHGTGDPSNTLW